MKRNMKIALAGIGLLAVTGVGAGLVMADGDGSCRYGSKMMRGAWNGDFKGMADGRLERLHADLNLRAEQQAAWDEFSKAVSEQVAGMGEKAKAWRSNASTGTAVERLERVQQGLDQGRAALAKLTTETKRFYGVLDPAQQKRFDELTQHRRHGGFGHGV